MRPVPLSANMKKNFLPPKHKITSTSSLWPTSLDSGRVPEQWLGGRMGIQGELSFCSAVRLSATGGALSLWDELTTGQSSHPRIQITIDSNDPLPLIKIQEPSAGDQLFLWSGFWLCSGVYLLWWRYCWVNMLSSLSSQPALFLTKQSTHSC